MAKRYGCLKSDRRDWVHHNVLRAKGCCPVPNKAVVIPKLCYHCLGGMAEVGRRAADILIDRHKVAVSIFFVHCLSNKIYIIIEALHFSLPDHFQLEFQWFYEH